MVSKILKMNRYLFLFVFLVSTIGYSQTKSPAAFFPNYGKQVTYYHQVEKYFEHLLASSDWIQYKKYGETTQERNLNAYYISLPKI